MEPFIGQIQAFAFNFAPRGWAPCEGQLLPIPQNTVLFTLLGTRYGGDGKTTFGLPKLAPVGPNGPNYCIALAGVFPGPPS
jgi:microcystin-dependent protein